MYTDPETRLEVRPVDDESREGGDCSTVGPMGQTAKDGLDHAKSGIGRHSFGYSTERSLDCRKRVRWHTRQRGHRRNVESSQFNVEVSKLLLIGVRGNGLKGRKRLFDSGNALALAFD